MKIYLFVVKILCKESAKFVVVSLSIKYSCVHDNVVNIDSNSKNTVETSIKRPSV